MRLSETLARLRKECGYTQPQVAQFFCDRGCPITNKAVSKWEKGDSKPDAAQFLLLCEIYGVRDVLQIFCGMPAADTLSSLTARGKSRAQEYIALLAASEEFGISQPAAEEKPQPEQPAPMLAAVPEPVPARPVRTLPLYDWPDVPNVQAFFKKGSQQQIEVDETVPRHATFAMRMSGDCMHPRFANEQIIYLQQQQMLLEGEIGLFLLNGKPLCRLLGGNRLLAYNKKYPPILIKDEDECRIIGKVVG